MAIVALESYQIIRKQDSFLYLAIIGRWGGGCWEEGIYLFMCE
jgi:hypothetical protein